MTKVSYKIETNQKPTFENFENDESIKRKMMYMPIKPDTPEVREILKRTREEDLKEVYVTKFEDNEVTEEPKSVLNTFLDKFEESEAKDTFDNIFKDEWGHALIYQNNKLGQIKMTDKSGTGYVYLDGLWKKKDSCYFNVDIVRTMELEITESMKKLTEKNKNSEFVAEKIKKMEKIQKSCYKSNYAKGVLEFTKSLFKDNEFVAKLNKASNLLPIKGGKVLDLQTLKVRQRTRDDLFDFEMDCNFLGEKANLANAEKFFSQIMKGDKDVVDYLQTNLGYCLTAEINQHCIYILWGEGANGKSTLCDLMSKIMGRMSVAVDKKIFIKSDSGASSHTAHLIPLIGARLGVFSESEKSEKLNGSLIKTLTGGDIISARAVYGDQFEFKPCAKYIFLTNHKPTFDISDKAILRRIRYVPFLATFKEEPKGDEYLCDHEFIKNLTTTYLDEVFTWLCIGAHKYYNYVASKKSIPIPQSLTDAKNAYMGELDTISQFITESCKDNRKENEKKPKLQFRTKRGDLYDAYKRWRRSNGEGEVACMKDFYARVALIGYDTIKTNGFYYFVGIAPVVPEEMIE